MLYFAVAASRNRFVFVTRTRAAIREKCALCCRLYLCRSLRRSGPAPARTSLKPFRLHRSRAQRACMFVCVHLTGICPNVRMLIKLNAQCARSIPLRTARSPLMGWAGGCARARQSVKRTGPNSARLVYSRSSFKECLCVHQMLQLVVREMIRTKKTAPLRSEWLEQLPVEAHVRTRGVPT